MDKISAICVYWRPRQETPQQCAIRLRHYFDLIEIRFPALNRWYQVGVPKKRQAAIGCASDYDLNQLASLIEKGANKRDMPPRDVIPELGFRRHFYDRRRGDTCTGLSIGCGAWRTGISNSVVLNVPFEPSESGLKGPSLIETVFELGRVAWGATSGRVFNYNDHEPCVSVEF